MNYLQYAYEEGVKAAAAAHGVGKLVSPGAPKAHAPTPSTTMGKSPTSPGGSGGISSTPSAGSTPATMSSTNASTIPSLASAGVGPGGVAPQPAITPQSLATQTAAAGAGTVFQLGSAGQRHSVRTMGTELPGLAGPATANGAAGNSAAKMGEFNMGMTPDPATLPDKGPKADNGRRMYGTNFSDCESPLRDISSAFDALRIPKNTDVLNEAGQMEFGAPRG